MKPFAKQFYNSKAWRDCRASYIAKRMQINGGLCERCQSLPGYIMHHKIYLTPLNIKNPDITLNHCNLEYICKKCHDEEHEADFRGMEVNIKFDSNGRIIPPKR